MVVFMYGSLAKAFGWVATAVSAIFMVAKFFIWFVGLSTIIDDSKALPEKGKAMIIWIESQPDLVFYGSLAILIVVGLWLAFHKKPGQPSIDRPRRIWPWQWRKIDQLEMLYLPQWAAVASGHHPDNLATDEFNNLQPWFREFQRIKGAINSGTLLVDGKRSTAGGKTYLHRKFVVDYYKTQGDLKPAFFPEKRILNALRSRLGANPQRIEKPDEPPQLDQP